MPNRPGGTTRFDSAVNLRSLTIRVGMPIYEFKCESCGARFDGLVPPGTDSIPCRECGAERTTRVLSAPSARPSLVKTPAEARRQEQRNAKLHDRTKARFKEARQRARDSKKGGGGNPPAGAA